MAEQQSPNAVMPVSQIKTADDLVKRMDLLRRGRGVLEQQWKLNLAFYKGKQYSYFNRFSRQIQSLPVDDGDKPRYRVRLVSNQIITGAHSLLAKYTKTKPVISATPGSGSQSDVKAAQMAESLLEFWWDDFQLDDKLEEALLWAIIAGQGYWKISWDPHAAKQMRFMLDPQGKPITDDAIKDAFKAQLNKVGVEPQEKIVYMGDIKVEAISPFNVYLDPAAKTFEDCKYAVCVHNLEIDEIKARWNVDVVADAVNSAPDAALSFDSGDASEKTVKQVYIGYFLPTAAMPDGRYVVWIDNPKQILQDEKWPYPMNKLPLVKFPGLRNPGQIYDSAHVEHAIPLQKELNRTLSQLVEYKNLTIRPRVWAPTGSLRTRLTTEPGVIYEYNPIGNHRPEVEQLPAIPPYVFEHLGEISSRLKEIFALTDITQGTPPPNVEAGIAIDLLEELSADRLMPTIKLIEKGMARAGQVMLSLAQQYYIEPRLLRIRGSSGSTQVQRFTQADIQGGVSVHVETGSGLPRTRAGRQAQIERWVDQGIIAPDKAWKYLDIADLKGLASQLAADEDQAYRENDKIVQGLPINPEAVQQAMQQVNSPINPQTQAPWQPGEQQEALHQASLQPRAGENYDVHLDVHAQFMKSVEFESLPIQTRQDVITHWELTLQTKMSLPGPFQAGKVNTNVQIKATVGPTVASEILTKQGVPATPEQFQEPPLETWVSDSVDQPDTDAAGPGQEANHLSQAAATLIDAQTKQADSAQAAQINSSQHEQTLAKNEQDLAHQAELHHHAARKAAAEADFAQKKASLGPPKPAPKSTKKK